MPSFTLADFRKDLSPKYKLVPKLDKAIADFDEEWDFHYEPKQHDLYWHPSGHCVPKPSELYDLAYDRLNGEEEDLEFKRKMAKFGPVGHFWHQFLQHIMVRYEMVPPEAIERSAFKAWSSVGYHTIRDTEAGATFAPFNAAVGNADVAPWVYKDHPYIVDFKTMSARSFQAVQLPSGFAAKYECQMNIYMDFFDYDHALIVAINKDTPHDFKEFEYRIDADLVSLIYEKWKFVAECLGFDERPDKDDDDYYDGKLKELLSM